MDRFNSEGILLDHLPMTLNDRRKVAEARRIDSCLLCRRHKVNEAGVCEFCYSQLDGESLRLAVRWLSGVGP